VNRAVTRIITAGTVTEDAFLVSSSHNYVASLWLEASAASDDDSRAAGIAWMDVSTGAFFTSSTTLGAVLSELSRHPPAELLLCDGVDPQRLPALAPLLHGTATGLEACTITRRACSDAAALAALDDVMRPLDSAHVPVLTRCVVV
jgi:DNA mismatch repair ATPase MutS